MRILYVVHQFYPRFVTGTEQYVLALAREGRAGGDDVRVFTLDPDLSSSDPPTETRRFEHEGVPVVRYRFARAIRNRMLADYEHPEVGPPFRALLDEFRPDLVHVFHLRWHGVDRIEDIVERSVPLVIHLMDFWFVCPNFLLLRPDGANCEGPPDGGLGCIDCVCGEHAEAARTQAARERYARQQRDEQPPRDEDGPEAAAYALMRRPQRIAHALARADLVLSPSNTVRDALAELGRAPPNLEIIPYGVDRTALQGLPEPETSPIRIGFIGTLAPHKGADVLVRAFRRLDDPELRLCLHGRAGDHPPFDQELQRLTDGDERIERPGGFERADLPRVLAGLHVVVVPSRWRENTPFVCLEARAAGVELVASDLPGMSEAVPEGRGRLFRAGDDADLGEVLARVVAGVRERGGRRLPPDDSIADLRDHWRDVRSRYLALVRRRRGFLAWLVRSFGGRRARR